MATPTTDGTPSFPGIISPTTQTASTTSAAPSSAATRTAQQEAASQWLATLVVFGILGLYALLFTVVIINWLVTRFKHGSSPPPSDSYLPPEATERGKGAFLVPTPQGSHDPHRSTQSGAPANFSRPSGGRARSSTASSIVPKRPQRPPGVQLHEVPSSRHGSTMSTRSGLGNAPYGGNMSTQQSTHSLRSPFADTYSPSGSPSGLPSSSLPGASRSRASSVSSARYFHEGYTPDRAPQMPPLSYQGGRW
jgi:hypothetical protein